MRHKKDEPLRLLLKAGADVNAKTKDRDRTPLIIATESQSTAAVKLLLNSGEDKAIKDGRRRSAVYVARKQKKPDLVKSLEADPNN